MMLAGIFAFIACPFGQPVLVLEDGRAVDAWAFEVVEEKPEGRPKLKND
jgi:hypothetical protein